MTENSNDYTWLPFFEELLDKICTNFNSHSLYKIWTEKFSGQYNDIDQMDPFSFIGKINSFGIENRKQYCEYFKSKFGLKAETPLDLTGVPKTNSVNSIFFNEYLKKSKNREKTIPMDEIMNNLWELAKSLNSGKINDEIFEIVLGYNGVGLAKLTQLFFLCKPRIFYSYDANNRAYLENKTGDTTENSIKGFYKFQELAEKVEKNIHVFSHDAWLNRDKIEPNEVQNELEDNHDLNEKQRTNATSEIKGLRYVAKYIKYFCNNKHNPLEKSFKNFLLSSGVEEKNIKQNKHYIDFIFSHKDKKYICELKPSDNVKEIKYAIRSALGQIIEYNYDDKNEYDYKVIVFQKKPNKDYLKFLEHLETNYKIYYLTEIKKNNFIGNLPL